MDASIWVVLGVGATLFFLLAWALERVGLLDDPPCDCEACWRARRDVFRAWDR